MRDLKVTRIYHKRNNVSKLNIEVADGGAFFPLVLFYIDSNIHFYTDSTLSTSSQIRGDVANWPRSIIMLLNDSLTISVNKSLQRRNVILGFFFPSVMKKFTL